jgi:dethiobiotin synthetase
MTNNNTSKKLFITGTGTDIGKTYVTGLIVKKLLKSGRTSAYYKAAMSGNERRADGSLIPGDALQVQTIAHSSQPLEEMCPYIYEAAVSPHLAARIEGSPVDMQVVQTGLQALEGRYEYITMEGSGGILCPIRFERDETGKVTKQIFLENVIKNLNLSCLLIADAGLGTINSVVLTAEYMRAKNIPLKGIIFNNYIPGDIMQEDNLHMCEYMTGLKVLACVRKGDTDLMLDVDELAALYE